MINKSFLKEKLRPTRDALRNILIACLDLNPSYIEWYLTHSNRLRKLKNLHQGEDCFIIGNGPSLKKMDLERLNNYYTFGLNKIYFLLEKVNLELSYHVAVNPLVIEQGHQDFVNLQCPSFLKYKPSRRFFDKNKRIYYISQHRSQEYIFSRDISVSINEGHTVTFVAMQIAFYMGFRRVFLIGVDHNFNAQGSPNEKQTLQGDDPNHFDPRYFANQEWQLPDLEASELSYNLAKFFFNRDGRQIYDATADGKLKIFPKISYEEALNKCKLKTKNRF